MDSHQELGWSDQELLTHLSRYLDGEADGAEAEVIEDHLKDCDACRATLSGLRGADRFVERSIVDKAASPGFVARVMSSLSGRGVSAKRPGRRVPPALLWAIVGVATLGVVVLAIVVARAYNSPAGPSAKEIPIAFGDAADAVEAGTATWEMRAKNGFMWVRAEAGDSLRQGALVRLAENGGAGTLVREDGLIIHVSPGSAFEVDALATDVSGLRMDSGVALIDAPATAAGLELELGAVGRLIAESGSRRIHLELSAGVATVGVMVGRATMLGSWGSRELVAMDVARASVGGPMTVAADSDLRALRLNFVPSLLRPSAWPQEGGSASRNGRSPFRIGGAPRKVFTITRATRMSSVALGLDGTAFILVGPAPGRLVGIREGKEVVSRDLTAASKGSPIVAPDGHVLVATERGITSYDLGPGAPVAGVRLVEFATARSPAAGPSLGRGGDFYVIYARGITAHAADGTLLWERDDIIAGDVPSVGPDGTVFVASVNGRLHALDRRTGADMPSSAAPIDDTILASPAVARDGTAYAVSGNRYLIWRTAEGLSGRVTLPDANYTLAPAITSDGSIVVVSAEGAVYLFSPRPTSAPAKTFFDAGEAVSNGPVIDGGDTILLWTASGKLLVVSPTGRPTSYDIGAREASGAAIGPDGKLYFAARGGTVYGN
jgi:outer membrane protein assembly factor BamB